MIRFVANVFWFLSCLPNALAFWGALFSPQSAQRGVARRQRNAKPRDREILFHEPTSGSTGGTKLIPYTRLLRAEFRRGINPWIYSLFLHHPRLFFGTHYWSISPSTRTSDDEGAFADDREYLGFSQRLLTRALFAVPSEVREISDPDTHATVTLLYLLSDRRLGLISVWHPSLLLILMRHGIEHRNAICDAMTTGQWPGIAKRKPPNLKRAEEVWHALAQGEGGFQTLWPRLALISCWDQARARGDAEKLRALFPRATVQGKGLLATEGIVTIPWQGRLTAALRSHVLHFRHYPDGARDVPLHEIKTDSEYAVLLTTGNGFERYPLGDIVRCTGFVRKTPCFDFVSRAGGVVDLRGEKLHAEHVEAALRRMEGRVGAFAFAMLAPNATQDGYVLFWEAEDGNDPAEALEAELQKNFHYRHARNLAQLQAVRAEFVSNAMEKWRAFCVARGMKEGAVKNPSLYNGTVTL